MNDSSLLASLFFLLLLAACNNAKPSIKTVPKNISVQVSINDATTKIDSLRIYAWKGMQVEIYKTEAVKKTDKGVACTFELGKVPEGMYFVGTSLRDIKPYLLGTEPLLSVETASSKMTELKIVTSDLNKEFESMIKVLQANSREFVSLLSEYQSNKNDKKKQKEIKHKMAKSDDFKLKLLDSLKQENSALRRMMAFSAFQSYQNNAPKGLSEADYFAQTFFQFVDFKDTVYNRFPFYYENIKNYSKNIGSLGLSPAKQRHYLDSLLSQVPETHPNHMVTLIAVSFGMIGKNNDLFSHYAKQYLAIYKGKRANLDKYMEQQMVLLKGPPKIGDEAPNLKGETPDGKPIEMHELRGKVLLLDFWASWCGPCRRENPNVVKLYNKYKDQGFEILGISLDDNRERWKGAIEKDGLTWHHMSDLHGRGSPLSQIYGVRGIPYTVLLDKEGKIIATNLRGGSLEAKLDELLGK